jgi:hypothetical protein
MKLKDKLSHHAKVASRPTECPKQVRVFCGAGRQDVSASGNYGGLRASEVINEANQCYNLLVPDCLARARVRQSGNHIPHRGED